MVMQSPEILLLDLNSALRRLRGACTELGNEEIDEKLLEVMRRLLLAEVLGNTWIIAIGGSQGAGKTTLMSCLYDLRDNGSQWLKSNEGRGEKIPVLIIEDKEQKEPQGFIRRLVLDKAKNTFKLADITVDVTEFQRTIYDPNAEDLLPVLKVPSRYLKHPNQAWLLLPGYEKQERTNRSWQELMRQAMIAAGGCIVVTDETRMANSQQLEIVKDMLENELKNCKPYIVISKTEAYRHNPLKQSELRATAQATFQVDINNIILSGSDDPEYMKTWMPHLHSAIDDLNFTGQSDRYLQMRHLSEIVGKDLTRVLNSIRSKSRLYFSDTRELDDGNCVAVLEDIMEAFDEAVELLRNEHNKLVKEQAGNVLSAAQGKMESRLVAEREGFRNWISNAFDTTTETKCKMQQLVQDSWQEASQKFFKNYVNELSTLTINKLKPTTKPNPNRSASTEAPIGIPDGKCDNLIQLEYMHESGQFVQFDLLTPEKVRDITILLGHSSKEEENKYQDFSVELKKSVELIPIMALEYTRIFYALPNILADNHYVTPSDELADINIVEHGVETLNKGAELGKTAIRSAATLLAVDIVSDGDSDILGALFGKKQPVDIPSQSSDDITGTTTPSQSSVESPNTTVPMPMTLHPAAIAAAGVVAAAYLTATAMTRIRTVEKNAHSQAHSMLHNIHDHYIGHLQKQFDETMTTARSRIKETIQTRYHMDEELMRKDRLAKAISDVTSIISDLRYELDSSAVGLQPFIPD